MNLCRYCGDPTTCPPGREVLLVVSDGLGSFEPVVVCPRAECLDLLASSAAFEAREVELEAGGPACTVWVPPTAR